MLLPPSWSRYGEVSFFLGTDDLRTRCFKPFTERSCANRGWRICGDACRDDPCGLVLGTFAGATPGLRSAVLNHILDTLLAIPSLLLAIIVVVAGPSLSHAMFAVWLALLPRMVRSIYSMVHDELEKEYVIAARLDGASTLNILWFAVMPNITAGLVTEITRALSMAILDIAALEAFSISAHNSPRLNGERCSVMLELIYVARGLSCCQVRQL